MLQAPPFIPSYQFHECHLLQCEGCPQTLLKAFTTLNLRQDALIGFFMTLREKIPAFFSRPRPENTKQNNLFGLEKFTRLETTPTRITLGLIGRFWSPTFGLENIPDLDAFKAFAAPGVPKLVMTFEAYPCKGTTIELVTQTWIYCPDKASRFKMQFYWALIRPASGLIRRRILALAAKQGSQAVICA